MPLYQLVLSFPTNVGDTPPKIRLQYDASDPEAMAANPTWPDTPFLLPEEGLIRIWRRADTVLDPSAAEARWTSGPQGDFVAPEVAYTEQDLEGEAFDEDGVVTLYIQGVRAGVGTVQFWLDVDGDGPGGFALADEVKYTALDIDIIGNSLNMEGFDPSEALAGAYGPMTAALAEQMGNNPAANPLGMILIVNDNDDDGDGIVDWADGYNLDGSLTPNADDRAANPTTTPWVKKEEQFAKIEVKFDGFDFSANSKARIRIDYDASPPLKVDPVWHVPTDDGLLRLWTKDGYEPRRGASIVSKLSVDTLNGYYVPPRSYGRSDWQKMGLGPTNNTLTLFLEAVRTAPAPNYTTTVTVMIDPNGNGEWHAVATLLVRPVRINLDVNANDSLDDPVDGATNYLPGYAGVPVLSSGTTMHTMTYLGQAMKLIAEGLGSEAGISRVWFRMNGLDVSSHLGYASNTPATAVPGNFDYSFDPALDVLDADGIIAEGRTWVDFYARDYGGSAIVEVYVEGSGWGPRFLYALDVPADSDGDGIADRWEREMGALWNLQFGDSYPINPAFFVPWQDNERVDPDGANMDGFHDMPEHRVSGDGKTVFQEYRGYIVSGGEKGFTGGHVRLEPHYKELLVEMDVMGLRDEPPAPPWMPTDAQLSALMGTIATRYNHLRHGSGVKLYWVEDEMWGFRSPYMAFPTIAVAELYLLARKNPLLTGFVPLLFADVLFAPPGVLGVAPPRGGSIVFLGALGTWAAAPGNTFTLNDAIQWTVAHELTHNLVELPPGGKPGWAEGEHVRDGNGNGVADEILDKAVVLYPWSNNFNAGRIYFVDIIRRELSFWTTQARAAMRRP
jgi:hypothetical protein